MSDFNNEDSGSIRSKVQPHTRQECSDNATSLRQTVSSIGRRTLRAEPAWTDSSVSQASEQNINRRALSSRWRHTSRSRNADGNTLRKACGRGDLKRPNFNIAVPPNGYAWWYIDGINTAADRAISVIGFIGSVFSPWYRWSGRRNPENHVCINVATYGSGGRFTMTDRGQTALRQSEDLFQVGQSSMNWDKNRLIIDVNEIGSPPMVSRV